MDFTNFLHKIRLSHLVEQIGGINLNEFVDEIFHLEQKSNKDKTEQLYRYRVPKLTPDGSCSLEAELEDKPYDLSQMYEINPRNSLWLWRLNQLISTLQAKMSVDWLGIYKKVRKENGDEILLKLAYYGAPSRAEFPMTKEFASHSNNSTVGLTGKAILLRNVAQYKGPYYKCDTRVKSEFCCPIVNDKGDVIGIVDAESFADSFFNNEKVLQISKVCSDLSVHL